MAFSLQSADGEPGRHRIGSTLAEINIIPLVDVILVLLLIFMLTAPLMHRGIDVNLPRSSGKPTAVEERVVITLSKDGRIYVNETAVPAGGLETRLRDLYRDRADKTAYLKADEALQYGLVVETMDRVRRAGVERLGMVTEPARER